MTPDKDHPSAPPGQPWNGGLLSAWPAYAVDAWQRSILFFDVLRQRGNTFLEHAQAQLMGRH